MNNGSETHRPQDNENRRQGWTHKKKELLGMIIRAVVGSIPRVVWLCTLGAIDFLTRKLRDVESVGFDATLAFFPLYDTRIFFQMLGGAGRGK